MRYFEDCGVVIGLISYPDDVEGKTLYEEAFKEGLFKGYKDEVLKYSYIEKNDVNKTSKAEFDEIMYDPRGYRLFGDYGLAVISLIDDFSFSNRVFHSKHRFNKNVETNTYNCQVITGTSNSNSEAKAYIKENAQNTFLRKKEKFPFIGITKLKVKNELLIGIGIDLTNAIKIYIIDLAQQKKEFACIVVDCFDNDELTLLSFSTNLVIIHDFSTKIRATIVKDLGGPDCEKSLLYKNMGDNASHITDAHVFSSTHTSLGYDVDFCFTKPLSSFLTFETSNNVKIKLRWEAKPGHIEEFKKTLQTEYAKQKGDSSPLVAIDDIAMTGGNTISVSIPLEDIHIIEAICLEKNIKKHTRKLRIRLSTDIPKETNSYAEKCHEYIPKPGNQYVFEKATLAELRNNLEKCRVFKTLRERLLKLFGLYNTCVSDPLLTTYFLELRGALANILKMVRDYEKDGKTSIKDISDSISKSITAIEEAYYNRIYQRDIKDTNLEYNGGIQQYIISLDWVYKQLLRLLTPKNINESHLDSFIYISGYERVSSARSNLRLNINLLTYPELFITTVWKEASNFTFPFQDISIDERDYSHPLTPYIEKYKIWHDFILKRETIPNMTKVLRNASYFDIYDETFLLTSNLLNGETIKYLYIDHQTYHFGFNRDFELFYHFYWKYFLQTSQYYDRNGHVNKRHFIGFLFRICMISFADIKEMNGSPQNRSSFLKSLRFKPFDPSLADLWFTCFNKVFKCAETIWKELNKFYFEESCTCEIAAFEMNGNYAFLDPNPNKINHERLKDPDKFSDKIKKASMQKPDQLLALCRHLRKEQIIDRKKAIQRYMLVFDPSNDDYLNDANYLICLLNGYLQAVKELDETTDKSIKCIPRQNGNISLCIEANDEIKSKLIGICADPLGGMFISDMKIRKQYFAYRLTLYKNLWDYTMKSKRVNRRLFESTKDYTEKLLCGKL